MYNCLSAVLQNKILLLFYLYFSLTIYCRFNMINLAYHQQDYGISASWHFFATSHGKNACDGIGGTVKRLLSKAALQGILLNDAETIFGHCSEHIAGIK